MIRTSFYKAACIALIYGATARDEQRAIDWARIALGLDALPAEMPPGVESKDSYRETYPDA